MQRFYNVVEFNKKKNLQLCPIPEMNRSRKNSEILKKNKIEKKIK